MRAAAGRQGSVEMAGREKRLKRLLFSGCGVLCLVSPLVAQIRPAAVRVSEGFSQSLIVKKVNPEYPQEARTQHIQGKVVLVARISADGDVNKVTLISGHPMLAPAAIAAVKQWKYKPYLLNGQPFAMETQVSVDFTLESANSEDETKAPGIAGTVPGGLPKGSRVDS